MAPELIFHRHKSGCALTRSMSDVKIHGRRTYRERGGAMARGSIRAGVFEVGNLCLTIVNAIPRADIMMDKSC